MSDYLNLPIKSHGPVDLIEINLLPKQYEVFQHGTNKAHFVHELNFTRETVSKGTAVCGREVKRIETDNEKHISRFCSDCLGEMNEKMEGWLFDDKNEKYYNPMEEQ